MARLISRRPLRSAKRHGLRLIGTLLLLAAALAPDRAAGQVEQPVSDEYVVYFISATFCIANAQPWFEGTIREMMGSLRTTAEAQGRSLSIVGVSIDVEAREGVRYLERFGEFDEIVAGRNWLNTAVVELVWRGALGTPTIPQVIVVKRQIDRSNPRGLTVLENRRVLQIEGGDEIRAWVQRGAPVTGARDSSEQGN